MSEKHFFLEEFSEQAISMVQLYGKEMPDIRTVVRDTIDYLDGRTKKDRGFTVGRG